MQDSLRVLFRVAAADAAHGTTTEIPNAVGGVPYLLPPAPQSLGVGQRSRESAGCYVQPPMACIRSWTMEGAVGKHTAMVHGASNRGLGAANLKTVGCNK